MKIVSHFIRFLLIENKKLPYFINMLSGIAIETLNLSYKRVKY